MRSRTPAFVGLLAVALYASTAMANAPYDQYAMFDQTSSTIQDVQTMLIWQRQVVHADSWQGAQAYCDTLNLSQMMSYDCGWRVPSYKELLTLVDENPHGEYDIGSGKYLMKWIDSNAFLGTPVDHAYWTSSAFASDSSRAWSVSFTTGNGVSDDTGTTSYVRCVHDP